MCYEKIDGWQKLRKYEEAINDLMTSDINEHCTFLGTKLVKAEYLVNHKIGGIAKNYSYTTILGTARPWNKKNIVTKIYSPWL